VPDQNAGDGALEHTVGFVFLKQLPGGDYNLLYDLGITEMDRK
jgi:hypothetical protein